MRLTYKYRLKPTKAQQRQLEQPLDQCHWVYNDETLAVNRRNDFAHQESRKLVNRWDLIVFEDLDIVDMQGNGYRPINRNIDEVGESKFSPNMVQQS